MVKEKSFDDILIYVQRVAKKKGWIIHPNHDGTLDLLVEGLKNYYNRVGYLNCPCRDTEEDIKIDKDILCPCNYAQPDIDEFGRCYCALFLDENYDFNQDIDMIPERRPEIEY